MDRRKFLKSSLFSSMALGVPFLTSNSRKQLYFKDKFKGDGPEIIDTNINLFEWPFKTLKYSTTQEIVDKLSRHKISQAWAGTYEGLMHVNMDMANARLTEECREYGNDNLLPIGTVNTSFSYWEEDLRKCHESYQMKGIRIYPTFQMMELDNPAFKKLVSKATQRNMFIQIVGEVADPRHRYPIVNTSDIKFGPIVEVAKQIPEARIQLLHWKEQVDNALLKQLINETNVVFDISSIEGAGELGRLIKGESWRYGDVKIPVERLLFGSHMPYFIVEAAILRLFESPLSEQQFRSIAVENGTRFLTT